MQRFGGWRMIERRPTRTGMRVKIGRRALWWATGVTACVGAGQTLETAQAMAPAHNQAL